MKILFALCLLFYPLVCFSDIPPMTEYFKYQSAGAGTPESDVITLDTLEVSTEKVEPLSPRVYRALEATFRSDRVEVQGQLVGNVSVAVLPDSANLGDAIDNLLPLELWTKIHGGIKIGDMTAYIHSGLSWKISLQTEFICPLFRGEVHGLGFGFKSRF